MAEGLTYPRTHTRTYHGSRIMQIRANSTVILLRGQYPGYACERIRNAELPVPLYLLPARGAAALLFEEHPQITGRDFLQRYDRHILILLVVRFVLLLS